MSKCSFYFGEDGYEFHHAVYDCMFRIFDAAHSIVEAALVFGLSKIEVSLAARSTC